MPDNRREQFRRQPRSSQPRRFPRMELLDRAWVLQMDLEYWQSVYQTSVLPEYRHVLRLSAVERAHERSYRLEQAAKLARELAEALERL